MRYLNALIIIGFFLFLLGFFAFVVKLNVERFKERAKMTPEERRQEDEKLREDPSWGGF